MHSPTAELRDGVMRMAVVGPNIMNTIDVARRLPLVRSRSDAKHFTESPGFHALFLPTNLGGRLRIGFADTKQDAKKKRLGVVDPHGNVHTRDESGEVRIDIEVLRRGNGLFQIAVYDETQDYRLYAMFEESGTARQADKKPLIPWNFWYFPFAASRKDESAWGGTELQPLQKYERAFKETGVLAWEKAHHGDPTKSRPEWQGHCHLAAPASVMFVNPPAEGLEYNGVEFLAEELKFYAAEFVGRFGRFEKVYELPTKDGHRGGVLQEKKPSESPEVFGAARDGIVELLRMLRRELQVKGRALIMDLRDATGLDPTEVWNHAVYRYVTRYWQPDVADPTLTDGSCAVFANGDFYSGIVSSGMPARTTTRDGEAVIDHLESHEKRVSEFTVRFTADGEHDANAAENRWKATRSPIADTFAPRFAVAVSKPANSVVEPFGNPRIDPKHVLELLQLRPEFL